MEKESDKKEAIQPIPEPREKEGSNLNPLDKAELLAKRIEDANRKSEELLREQQELATRMILGGRSTGYVAPEPKKELTPLEIAKGLQNGTFNPYAQ